MAERLSVNVNDECARVLREMSERDQMSITEIIRRAVSVYKFITDEVANGKFLVMTDPPDEGAKP